MREAALRLLPRLPRATSSGGAEKAPARGNARLHSGHLLRKRRDLGFYKHPYLTFPSSRLLPWAFRRIPCLFTKSEVNPRGSNLVILPRLFFLNFQLNFLQVSRSSQTDPLFRCHALPTRSRILLQKNRRASRTDRTICSISRQQTRSGRRLAEAEGQGWEAQGADRSQVATKKQRARFKREKKQQKNGFLEDTYACIRGYARDGAGAFRE